MESIRRAMETGASYLGIYLAVMVPTYILPYFGSNSIVFGALSGGALLPQFLAHLLCLTALCVFAKWRGDYIGRSWLIAFPITAAVFDMVPLLNWIPLVPTIFHALALGLGASDDRPPDKDVFS